MVKLKGVFNSRWYSNYIGVEKCVTFDSEQMRYVCLMLSQVLIAPSNALEKTGNDLSSLAWNSTFLIPLLTFQSIPPSLKSLFCQVGSLDSV